MLKTAAGTILATIITGLLMQIWVFAGEISKHSNQIENNERSIRSMHEDMREIRKNTQDILKLLIKK